MSRAKKICKSEIEARNIWEEIPLGQASFLKKEDLPSDSRLKPIYRTEGNRVTFVCECFCGNWTAVDKSRIKDGTTKSCGCLHTESVRLIGQTYGKQRGKTRQLDITGQVFNNNLLALEPTGKRAAHCVVWRFKCLNCGKIFETNTNNVKRGLVKSCGCLTISYGEKVISDLLDKLDIFYQTQKTFDDLKSETGKFLRYDFFIPEKNALLEYDGIQHFQKGHFNMTEEEFEQSKMRDYTKNKYAIEHNIFLYRIPYTKRIEEIKNIEDLLNDNFLVTILEE